MTENINNILKRCTLCPRECGADRTREAGYCGGGQRVRAAKAYLHMWEEPCISGTRGSGTVFFSGCSLKCVYCQNYELSAENFGKEISVERLAEIFLELQGKGTHNINLVTGCQYVPHIIQALDICGGRLHIPVVYNSSGYEKVETVEMLRGYADIFIPDMKYFDRSLAEKYSCAPDYPETAFRAVSRMIDIAGKPVIDGDGIMQRGVIIRHLVLPGHYKDSMSILRRLHADFPPDSFLLSLMSQYTPMGRAYKYKNLSRRLSTYEYEKVTDLACELGFEGYMQERCSAKEEYTPDFDMGGI